MPTELTWLGHACWLIDTGDTKIILDPFLDESPTAPIKSGDVAADFILISHGHGDHIGDCVKIARRDQARRTVISNYEICEWLGKQGVEKTDPHNLGGGSSQPFGRVQLTLAHHSSVLPDGANGGNPSGFLLTLTDGKIYFACDTALFRDMQTDVRRASRSGGFADRRPVHDGTGRFDPGNSMDCPEGGRSVAL